MILRVDRADLSKNVLRGFTAFDIFLEQHPEFRERVTFIAHLQPSRQDVPEYVEYLEKIEALVAVINHRHGTTDWMPIDLRLRDDFEEAVALYKHFDLLLVNAMWDGMNLVAKEGPLINTAQRDDDPVREHGRPRGARRLRHLREPVRRPGAGRRDVHAPSRRRPRRRARRWRACGRSSPRARRPTGSTTSSRDIERASARARGARRRVRTADESAVEIGWSVAVSLMRREPELVRGSAGTAATGRRRLRP